MRAWVALLILPLAGCLHDDAEFAAPAWRAGDEWEMATQDLGGGVAQLRYKALGPGPGGTWTFRVAAEGAPNQTIFVSPLTMRFSNDAANASKPPEWPWPLEDGETWTGVDSGVTYTSVAKREPAETAFGTIAAMRVTVSNASGPVQDMWYAPAARFWARVVDHPTGTTAVLTAYRIS